MKARLASLRLLLAAVLAVLLVMPVARAAERPVTIFAAASTTDAVQAVIARYAEAHGEAVRPVFAASSTLAKQIAAGAPADLYLSANDAWMDWLDRRGGIDRDSRVDLLGNGLVIVVPGDAAPLADHQVLPDYLGERRLAMGDPAHVPAGRYARAALQSLDLWKDVRRRSAFGSDVRAALAMVARGEAAAGVVYTTDARISDDVRVAAEVPPESHPPIRYPLALARQPASEAARRFYDFLRGAEAAGIFGRHGFRVHRLSGNS